MTEQGSNGKITTPDHIALRYTQVNAQGEAEQHEVPLLPTLPKGRIHYGARPEKSANPKPSPVLTDGIDRLDMRGVGINGGSEIAMAGEAVGGEINIKLHDGTGAAEVRPGVEVVVYASNLINELRAEKQARDEAPKPNRSPDYQLQSFRS